MQTVTNPSGEISVTGQLMSKSMLAFAFALWLPLAFGLPDNKALEAQYHVEAGLQLAQAGDLTKAETEVRKAVELSPN